MRRVIVWQYILIAAAWLMAFCALPLDGAELNGFLLWRGDLDTKHFVQFLFALPRQVIREWNDPAIRNGIHPNGIVAPTTFAYGDLLWLAAVLLGLLSFIFAPIIVKKYKEWSRTALVVLRCFAPIILVFPFTMFVPAAWGFPIPKIGMYILGLAHVLIFAALILSQSSGNPNARFPVEPKAL